MQVSVAVIAALALAACGSLPVQPDFTSVESVLRHSEELGRQLDRQARELASSQGKKEPPRVRLQQPLRVMRVTSHFGKRRGRRHDGIDINAPIGTPVYASEAGIVVFAGVHIDGYGETIIVRHPGGLSTLYAHNSVLRVVEGEAVTKGQCIAYSGDTGNASGPHLHFEVREGLRALNPANWVLPRPRKVASEKKS